MNRTNITQKTIDYCAENAPYKDCEQCACNEKECIENLYEILHADEIE